MRGIPVVIPSKKETAVQAPCKIKYYYPLAKEFWAHRFNIEWTMDQLVQCAELVEEAVFQSATSYMELSCELGVTGKSILLQFNKLCGWDMVRDSMFDMMHILLLCIVQNLLTLLVTHKDKDGHTILNVEILKERCRLLFPCWPTEYKEKRVLCFHETEVKGKLPALKGRYWVICVQTRYPSTLTLPCAHIWHTTIS